MKKKRNHLLSLFLLITIIHVSPIHAQDIPDSSNYLFVHSFCEGETPYFFPDPPILLAPCVSSGCIIYSVEVEGTWQPVNGREPFPPLQTAEYKVQYPSHPCPVSECGFTGGLLNLEAYEEAVAKYEETLAEYDGKLGLIEINNCQEEISPEDADVVITICRGDSVLLEGWRNVIECPCGPATIGPVDCFPFAQPGGTWTANGESLCDGCINQVVYPQATTLYVQQTPPYQCPAPTPVGSGPVGPAPPLFPVGPTLSVMVVVEENCEATTNERVELAEIVEEFPWVKEVAILDNCQIKSITVYTDGAFNYVLIQEGLTSALYLEDGTFYCTQSPTFNCVDAYNLNTITASWTCGSVGNSIGQNPPTCGEHYGTIFFDRCDDGRQFFFVKTADGQVLDIYFDAGVEFEYHDGQHVQFDFKPADFPSPCSVADMAVIVTCIEEINPSCSLLNIIDLIDNLCENCISEIAVYAYEGQTYLVTLADNNNCADGLTTVSNCSTGELFCMDGGFAGFSQCTDFFERGLKLETIVKDDCGGCICPEIFTPVCGSDGKTYGNECEAACAGVEVLSDGDCRVTTVACSITISNTQCRRIGVYDTNGTLLTTLSPGPFGNAPLGLPIPMWTDPTPLADNEQRTYVFKEGLFELGRTVATCATPEIDTRNSYAAGCNDGLSIGNYTNIGCRNVAIHRTDGSIIATLAPEESVILTATNYIYIFIAGVDTVDIKSDASGEINSGGCEEGCFCIALYDPVCGVDGNTYGNDCEAGCVGVEVAYRGICADAIVPPCHDVASVDFGLCQAIMGIAVVNGECTFVSGCGNTVVGGIDYSEAFFPSVEICAQSCATTPGNPIFEEYPWLTEFVDPANCTNERISVYQSGNFSFIEITTENSATLYFQDGSFYCESMPSFSCLDAYGLTNITASWACPREGCICTLEYAPVCGVDGKTYGNACAAACEGVEIASQGECMLSCICPTVVIPVCGADGKTYNNECEAACAGVEIISDGPCSNNTDCAYAETIRLDPCDPAIIETSLYLYKDEQYVVTIPDPALLDAGRVVKRCTDGSDFCIESPFPNFPPCGDFFEEAEKLEVLSSRADCSTSDCSTIVVSGGLFEIVIYDGRLSLPIEPLVFKGVEYFNNATGVGGIAPACFERTCSPEIRIPVEVVDGNNEFTVTVHFEAGVSCSYPVTVIIQEDCICPAVYMPVCGVDGKTYGNECEAACEGVEVLTEGECGCICTEEYDPVCGVDGRTYSNACKAACSGVEVASEGECSSNTDCDLLAKILLPSDLCGTCISEIAVYEYKGKTYLVTLASDNNGLGGACSDGLTMVQSCGNGNTFCSDGGIAGLTECEDFFKEATKVQVVVTRQNCEDCICPAVALPVCGVDGITYNNECEAACAGVEVASDGICGMTKAAPCTDLAGIDFGDCRAVMGVGIVNGQCTIISGCFDFTVNGVDYTEAFYPSVEVCAQVCPTPPGDPIFAEYPWLVELVDPTNCTNDKVTVYQSGIYRFLYVENAGGKDLYFENGTFYCQDSEGINCRGSYGLRDIIASWSCPNGGGSNCDNPLAQDWLRRSLDNECTGKIYQIDYNGTTAIYVSTLCGCLDDADMVFTCDGDFLCSIGRIAPDSRCMPDPSDQLTEDNLIWSPSCDCDCPAFKEPVCGVDGRTYPSACDAECAGVEVRSNGDCGLTITLTPPCYDVGGVDFGLCDAVLGVAVVDGICQTLSGCGLRIAGLDYTNSFFPTVEICQQTCGGGGSSNEVFTDYPWLTDFIEPNNCEDEKVTIYQSGIFTFLYLERGTSGILYFQDGTFYCQDGANFDCRATYSLTEVVATWSCGGGNQVECPNVLDQQWVSDLQAQSCTGKLYAVEYNGVSAIYVENRCLCLLPDAGNQLYNCNGESICNLGAFGPIGSGCDQTLFDQITDENIIWSPACPCDCVTPFPVCGTDGNTYSSACEASCAGVAVANEGACTTIGSDPLFSDYPWLLNIVNPNSCQTKAITEYDLGSYSFIYIFENAVQGTLYFEDGTFYCQDSPGFDCLSAYNLGPDLITRTWKCLDGLVYDAEKIAEERSQQKTAYFKEALTAYPNPTKGQFQIQINSTSTKTQTLTVVDLYGRILNKNNIQSNNTIITATVDISNEPDGLYMVILKAPGQVAIRKAVVKSGL